MDMFINIEQKNHQNSNPMKHQNPENNFKNKWRVSTLTIIKLAGERIAAIFDFHQPTTANISPSSFRLKFQTTQNREIEKQWRTKSDLTNNNLGRLKKRENLRVYRNREIRNQLGRMIEEEEQKAGNEAAEIGSRAQFIIKPAHNNHNNTSCIHNYNHHKIQIRYLSVSQQPMASSSSVA